MLFADLLVGVVEAGAALSSQSADLLPVGDELVLLQVDLGGILGMRLLQTLHFDTECVDLVHTSKSGEQIRDVPVQTVISSRAANALPFDSER